VKGEGAAQMLLPFAVEGDHVGEDELGAAAQLALAHYGLNPALS